MKYLTQFGILLGFWMLGDAISELMAPFISIPGTIVGMALLALALGVGLVKEAQIKELSDLFLGNIAFFFVPVSMTILTLGDMAPDAIAKIVTIAIISTVVTLLVTSTLTHVLTRKQVDHD